MSRIAIDDLNNLNDNDVLDPFSASSNVGVSVNDVSNTEATQTVRYKINFSKIKKMAITSGKFVGGIIVAELIVRKISTVKMRKK